MTLSELGNLGEFVGGVAVIASLIYLATQVRQAARSQRQEAFNVSLGKVNECLRSITTNADLARIYVLGCGDYAALDEFDGERFHSYLLELFVGFEMIFRMEESMPTTSTSAVNQYVCNLFAHPGVRAWWADRGKSTLAVDYVNHIEQAAAVRLHS